MPSIAGTLTLVFFLVLVPWGAYRTRGMVAQLVAVPRERYFRNVVGQQLLFGTIALLTMMYERVVVSAGRTDITAIGVAALILVATVLLMIPRWKAAVARRDERLPLISPRTPRQRVWWVAVSIVAGVSEEYVWRGVVAGLLLWMTGQWWLAAIVTSVAFGIAHSMQGWQSAAVITVLALVLQGLVWWSGGILLAMVVHAIYDIVAGLTYGRLCDEAEIPQGAAADTTGG